MCHAVHKVPPKAGELGVAGWLEGELVVFADGVLDVLAGIEGVELRGPLGLKGWALGRLRLKRLKTGLGPF